MSMMSHVMIQLPQQVITWFALWRPEAVVEPVRFGVYGFKAVGMQGVG